MPRFFVDCTKGDTAVVTGQDALHIRRSLRLQVGDSITLCDGQGTDCFCEIDFFGQETVHLRVLYRQPAASEPDMAVTLYQGLPKGDKLELIIQKTVELGVTEIVPVEMARSISRVMGDSSKAEKKTMRWQKIADEAAGQCGRGILPAVHKPIRFAQMLERIKAKDTPAIVFYEGGGLPLHRLIGQDCRRLAMVVGPEGGFDDAEIEALTMQGVQTATLGPRILRCETAPIAALSIAMALSGNMQ